MLMGGKLQKDYFAGGIHSLSFSWAVQERKLQCGVKKKKVERRKRDYVMNIIYEKKKFKWKKICISCKEGDLISKKKRKERSGVAKK